METVIIILTVGAMCIASFFAGAWVGSRKGAVIELPDPINGHRERKKEKAQKDVYETIMHNIDSYDGTSNGQLDIPRR